MGPSVGRQTRLVFFCSRDLPFFFFFVYKQMFRQKKECFVFSFSLLFFFYVMSPIYIIKLYKERNLKLIKDFYLVFSLIKTFFLICKTFFFSTIIDSFQITIIFSLRES